LGTYGHTATLIDGKIYFYGGQQRTGQNNLISTPHYFSLDVSRKFDPLNAPWTNYTVKVNADQTTIPPLNSFHTATAVGNKMYVYGGVVPMASNGQIPLTDTAPILWMYDSDTDTWSSPALSVVSTQPFRWRELGSVATSSGNVVLFGGKFDPFTGSKNGTFFSHGLYGVDTKSLKFTDMTTESQGPSSRSTHTVTMLSDGRMVVIGGRTNDQKLVTMSDIWTYDTNTGTWLELTAGGQVPVPRCAHSAVVTKDDRIIIYGGASDFNITQAIGDVAVLTTRNWTWTKPSVTNAPQNRFGHSATMVGNQMVVAFGNNPDTGADNSIHVLDTTTWTFTTTFDPFRYNDTSMSSTVQDLQTQQEPPKRMTMIIAGTLSGIAIVALAVGGFLAYRRYGRRIHPKDLESSKSSMIIGPPEPVMLPDKAAYQYFGDGDASHPQPPPAYHNGNAKGPISNVVTVQRTPTYTYSSRVPLEDPEEMFQTMDIQTFAVPRGKLRVVNE